MSLKKIQTSLANPSLRVRLVVIFTLLFGSLTAAFASFLYFEIIRTLQKDFDSALFNYAVDVSNSIQYERSGDIEVTDVSFEQSKVLPFPLGTALIQVRNQKGHVLDQQGSFGSFNPHTFFNRTAENTIDEARFFSVEEDEVKLIPKAEASTYRMIIFPIDSNSKKRKLFLEITVPMKVLEGQIQNRLQFIQWGVPLIILTSLLGALYFSSRALRPIADIIQTANSMNPQDLSQRIPIPPNKDEIYTLIQTLNSLFERIQLAYLSQERFVADASHQLLTPISLVRANLDLLKEQVDPVLQNDFKHALEQIDNLARIVQQMLVLARIDSGKDHLNSKKLTPDEVLFEAVSQSEKYATQKEIQFRLDLKAHDGIEMPNIAGDVDLLVHALRNLVENAIKYSPSQSTIELRLLWDQNKVQFEIQDMGAGVPEEMQKSIFERFNRGAHLNQTTPGFGLGLAISYKIAQLHQGHIAIRNAKIGSIFTLELPIELQKS